MQQVSDEELKEKIRDGYTLKDLSEASEGYKDVLANTLNIATDLEMMVIPMFYPAFHTAPDIETKMQLAHAIHDEMGHACVHLEVLDDLGIDVHDLCMNRDPSDWRSFMVTEYPYENWYEFAIGQAFIDRAGRTTTVDLEEHCSYSPYSRGLKKINYEQAFHVKNGENNVRHLINLGEEHKAKVQEALDKIFPFCVEWFGTTDDVKKRWTQIDFSIRGHTNDEMREMWLQSAAEFAEKMDLEIPASYDEDEEKWVLDYEQPVLYDDETESWNLDETVSWDEKFAQWKEGGPMMPAGVERMQSEEWGEDLWEPETA